MLTKILSALVLIGIISSFFSTLSNEIAGWRNRSVELVVDFDEVRILAEDAGLSIENILRLLKDSGVTAVALRETNIRRHSVEGRLSILQGGEILNALRTGLLDSPVFRALKDEGKIEAAYTYIITEDYLFTERLLTRLELAFGRQAEILINDLSDIIEIRASRSTVETLPIGLNPDETAMIQNIGLRIVGRPANIFMGNLSAVNKILSEYANLPEGLLSVLVFEGIEVSGFPDYLNDAAEILEQNDLRVGFIELIARQSGIEKLMTLTEYNSVIVHSNLRGRPVGSIVNAVKERGARLLYIRFHIGRRPAILEDATGFVAQVKDELARYGYYPGQAKPLGDREVKPFLHILAMLGVVAGAALLAINLKIILNRFLMAAFSLVFFALVGLYFLSPDITLQISSILAAMVFSTLVYVIQVVNRLDFKEKKTVGYIAMMILRLFIGSVLGGIMVAGLNSTPFFTSGAAVFRGVTITNIFPFIPVLWALYIKFGDYMVKDGQILKSAAQSFFELTKSPVTWLHVAVSALAAVIFYIYAARMGHQAGMTLLPFEDQMRRFLDGVLIVRPRTKEFLIAYPALIAGLTLFLKGNKLAVYPLIAIGALVPVSIINTFMHFTNPTILSSAFLRSFNGMWLGAAIGTLLLVIMPIILKPLKIKKIN